MALSLLQSFVEIRNIVMQSTCVEWFGSREAQSEALCVGLFPPTDVALRPRLLWTDVGIELLVGGLRIDTEPLTALAVNIVLDRSAAIECAAVHVVSQVYLQAEAEQIADLCARRQLHSLCHGHLAARFYLVSHGQLGLHVGHVIDCRHHIIVLINGDRLEVHGRISPSGKLFLQSGTHVVVGHDAPEVWFQRSTVGQKIAAAHGVLLEPTGLFVKDDVETGLVAQSDSGSLLVVLHLDLAVLVCFSFFLHSAAGSRSRLFAYSHLTVGDSLSLCHQRLSFLQLEIDVEHHLARSRYLIGQCQRGALLRSNVQVSNLTVLYGLTVLEQSPNKLIVAQIAEEVLVVDRDLSGFQIHGLSPNVLILISQLISVGVELTVGTDDTIAVEVVVAGVYLIVIAAIGVFGSHVSGSGLILCGDSVVIGYRAASLEVGMTVESLVYEVPVITALKLRILTYEIPVFLEVTTRVAHCVVVFALDQRACVFRIFGVGFAVPRRVVHGTEDVCVGSGLSGLLILHGTALILTLDPFVSSGEIRSVNRFVAQAPHDDTGMVEVDSHVVLVALQNLQPEVFFLGFRVALVAKAVAFLVGLSGDIETIFVTEVIPAWIVGIVTGTHRIDVQPFHDLDILNHAVEGDDISSVGIHFVAVSTLDEHGLSIDEQLTVFDFHLAETDFLRDDLHDIAAAVFDGGKERI